MSSFAALLLVGLVSLSTALPHKTKCKNFSAKHDFNAEAFFKGTWYVSHGNLVDDPVEFHELPGCLSITSQLLPSLVHQKLSVFTKNDTKYNYAEAFAALTEGVGKYVTECRAIKKDGTPINKDFYPLNTTIIDTDYDNYAITYNCAACPAQGFIGTNFGILSRSPNPDKIHPNVEVILNRLGLKLSDFVKFIGCPDSN